MKMHEIEMKNQNISRGKLNSLIHVHIRLYVNVLLTYLIFLNLLQSTVLMRKRVCS